MKIKALFRDKKFLRLMIFLAIPIAMQNLLNAALNIVDSLMVSMLGKESMSAVLLANQYVFIIQLVVFATASSSSVFIAQLYGRGTKEGMPESCGFSMLLSMSFTFAAVAATYFLSAGIMRLFGGTEAVRALGSGFLKIVCFSFIPSSLSSVLYFNLRGIKNVRLSVVGSLIGILLNALFNYMFMFGKLGAPEMGLNGAALGTVISRTVECVVVLTVVLVKKEPIIGKFSAMFRYSKRFVKQFFKVFLPACANEISWSLGTTMYLLVFARLPDSDTVLAALNITQSIDKLLFVFLIGIGSASAVIIGNSLGAGETERAEDEAQKSSLFALLFGIFLGAVTLGLSLLVPFFFGNVGQDSIATAQSVLVVYAVFMAVRAVNYNMVIGILRAGGDTRYTMLVETITVWLIAVPSVALCGLVFQWSVAALYILVFGEEFLKMFFLLHRTRSGKWKRDLTDAREGNRLD